MEDRIEWADVPDLLRASIEKRTGPVVSGRAVADGLNSPLAAVVETRAGAVFLKGMPSDHNKISGFRREAAIGPFVKGISPVLLWDFDEGGWTVLGFEYVQGRAASFAPGSPDLELIPGLMRAVASVEVPGGHGPVKYAEDRWKDHVADPGDVRFLAGTTLSHTDWMPGNVLISGSDAWLVDWAWHDPGR